MQVTEKIAAFRARMKDENFAAVIVPTADSHASEYIADYFKTRQWLSGFTGSAGTLVVGEKEAALFVDGRCGGMLSADIAGGEQGASALIRECSTIKFVPSLASFATTISYPAKTSHRAYSPEDMKAAGISMGQLRFSIGLEDAEDIIAELDEALEKV